MYIWSAPSKLVAAVEFSQPTVCTAFTHAKLRHTSVWLQLPLAVVEHSEHVPEPLQTHPMPAVHGEFKGFGCWPQLLVVHVAL